MALQSGLRLGTYEILSVIGAGGMGEVYRARDTKLGRDVAVKVLPSAFAYDPDRLSRFQREARMLAALNHPNIAGIYGLEDSGGTNYLVMELVPGETLADRIKREGKIPADEALLITRQIAEALEAAHEKGIIHRDLKPANITITPEGKVKVLDFGLAKVFEDGAANEDLNNSPTLTNAATMEGAILGTAAYMSPEQARGMAVDRRTDIWAFGCVIYEMLTGKRLFEGETISDTIALVLTKQPDLDLIPQKFRPLVRWCLEKHPKSRLRDVYDGMVLLDVAPEQPVESQAVASRPVWLMGLAAAFFLVALALGVLHFREKPGAPAEIVRYSIRLPEKVRFTSGGTFTISPDGRHVAFSAFGPSGAAGVWPQDIDATEARLLANTETGPQPPPFFWSPDSRYVVFSNAGPKLKKADIQTGAVEDICDKPGPPVGGSWNQDGVIIFGSTFQGLWKVAASGGTAVPLTTLDASRKERQHELPSFLPDGKHFIYLRVAADAEQTGIYVGSIDDPPERQNERLMLKTGYGASYVPASDSSPGRLLFLQSGTLMAQGFDPEKLELLGSPNVIVEGVGTVYETGYFAASKNLLIYRPPSTSRVAQYIWLDRQGKGIGKAGEPGTLGVARVSNDGKLLAYERAPKADGDDDIWVLDIVRDTSSRVTFGQGISVSPVWSPDGRDIAYGGQRGHGAFDLYRKAADGSGQEELLFKSNDDKRPFSWSHDGRFLIYGASPDRATHENLWVLPMQGEHKPFPLSQTKFAETGGQFSPDGRWVAYSSDETGRYEVYVKEFKDSAEAIVSGGKWTISNDGGRAPKWRADGKELYYVNPNREMIEYVDIDTAKSLSAGVPRSLFALPNTIVGVGMAGDAQRFLYASPVEQNGVETLTVVVNWTSGVAQ